MRAPPHNIESVSNFVMEGDIIESVDGLFFDVKGLVHPPDRVVAFIRYYPDSSGSRVRGGVSYKKIYNLKARYALLRDRFPQYLIYDPVFDEYLCEVPRRDIKYLYSPRIFLRRFHERLDELDDLERKALSLAQLIKERAGIPWNDVGVTGSVMISMHKPSSDIDLIVYGSKSCCAAYEALTELFSDGEIETYNEEGLKRLYHFRCKDTKMDFHDFVKVESRKKLQGVFRGVEFFIRLVKLPSEVNERYGDVLYKKAGWARIKAEVVNAGESIFTPCRYEVKDVNFLDGDKVTEIREIVSYRGRFCEQAREGERVIAQGKIEKVIPKSEDAYFRLILGSEAHDYMVISD